MFDSTSRYKDKIQSCSDAPMNAYRQDPWVIQSNRAYLSKSRDTVETSQQRLERSFMEKFKNGDFSMRSGKILILAQLSKGVVVILFLPPFFVFVLAPKWAFQTLSPLLAKALELAGEGGSRVFARISAWSGDVFAFIQHRMFSKFKKRAKIVPKVNRTEKKAPSAAYKKMESFACEFKAIWKSCSAFVRNSVKRAQESLRELAYKARSFAKAQLERLRKHIVSVFSKSVERALERVKSVAEAVAARVQAMDRRLASAVSYFVQPIQRAVAASAQAIYSPILRASIALRSFVHEKITTPFQNAIKAVLKAYQVVEQSLKSIASAITSRMPSLPSLPALPAMPTLNLAWLAVRFTPVRKNLSEKVKKASSLIAQIFTRAAKDCLAKGKSLLQKAKAAVPLIKGMLYGALEVIKRVPGFLWRFLKVLFRKAAWAFKRFIHAVRIGYTLTKVLLRYFWQELDKSLRMTQ